MDKQRLSPIERLEAEFNEKRERNHRYSLRQFARALDVPPGRLSEIISGKRRITPRMAEHLADKLNLKPEEREEFFAQLGQQSQGCGHNQAWPGASSKQRQQLHQLSVDSFYLISEWYHFAILSLMELDDFVSNPQWIAKRLGISVVQARLAIDRLVRLELIRSEDGKLELVHEGVATTYDVDSVALRNSHKQSLEQAKESLDTCPVGKRDITSITMAVDSDRLKQAKKMIENFRHELCEFLESGPKKDQVYNLNVQLYPLTEVNEQE